MSLWENLTSLFLPRENKADLPFGATAIDDLLAYLKSLINPYAESMINVEDMIQKQIQEYEETKNLPTSDRQARAIRIYLTAEDIIIKNKPPVIKEAFTKAALRQNIAKKVKIANLPITLRLIFLEEQEQKLYLFETGIKQLESYILKNLGVTRLKHIIELGTKGTMLEKITVDDSGIDFGAIEVEGGKINIPDLVASFKTLYSTFYEEIAHSFGQNNAQEIFQKAFEFVKKTYDYDLISQFLEVLPNQISEPERVNYLSRTDLEKKFSELKTEVEQLKKKSTAN